MFVQFSVFVDKWGKFEENLILFLLQGSVLQMAQFFTGIATKYHPPGYMHIVVVVANGMVALVGVLTAYLVHSEPEYFMKSAPKKEK